MFTLVATDGLTSGAVFALLLFVLVFLAVVGATICLVTIAKGRPSGRAPWGPALAHALCLALLCGGIAMFQSLLTPATDPLSADAIKKAVDTAVAKSQEDLDDRQQQRLHELEQRQLRRLSDHLQQYHGQRRPSGAPLGAVE